MGQSDLRVLVGDIFESSAQTLVNTVNCVGVMGKGVALQFKKRFPDMYSEYVNLCESGGLKLGRPYVHKSLTEQWVLNFPTKDHWRSVTKLSSLIEGLEYLVANYRNWGIESIAVPPLGCGYGQLEWRVVGPTLHRYLSQMEIPVELYAPYGTPHDELQLEFLGQGDLAELQREDMPEAQWIKPGWIALVEILNRVQEQPYHRRIGRIIFQKIAYIATEEGLPTGLIYKKGDFGPYAKELKSIITRLQNNGLVHEERFQNMFEVKVGSTYIDARKAYLHEITKWETIIDRTSDLFMRLDTRQSEIIASVIFAAKSLGKEELKQVSEMDVFEEVKGWKRKRKPALQDRDIATAVRNLGILDWLDLKASAELPVSNDAS